MKSTLGCVLQRLFHLVIWPTLSQPPAHIVILSQQKKKEKENLPVRFSLSCAGASSSLPTPPCSDECQTGKRKENKKREPTFTSSRLFVCRTQLHQGSFRRVPFLVLQPLQAKVQTQVRGAEFIARHDSLHPLQLSRDVPWLSGVGYRQASYYISYPIHKNEPLGGTILIDMLSPIRSLLLLHQSLLPSETKR